MAHHTTTTTTADYGTSALYADNGASYDDDGIGLYQRHTTAAADIDDSSGYNDEALDQAQCQHRTSSPPRCESVSMDYNG
jgi:hypothetical protein